MEYSGSIFNVEEIELVFPKFNQEEKMTESEICMKCHGCCTYVAVPLEYPRSADALDTYVWYLLHRNVEIEIDNYNKWFLVFKTPCDKLLPNGACTIYESRPEICRDYSADSCSRTAKDHTHQFKKPEELMAYIKQKMEAKRNASRAKAKSRAGKKRPSVKAAAASGRSNVRKTKARPTLARRVQS